MRRHDVNMGLPSGLTRVVRWASAVVVASVVSFVPGVSLVPGVPVATAAATQIDLTTPGPLGAITVIGDSVLVGASYDPSLPTLLAERGWGPVRFRADLGYSAGNFQSATSQFSAANWIRWWRDGGWDAPNVAVNLGNNDVGFCAANVTCNAGTIRYMLDAIGPDRQVWWSKITRIFTLTAEAQAYNEALDLVASERQNLHVWNWPAAQAATGIALGWDGIHLRDTIAYRQRSVLMGADITAQLAVARRTGVDAALPVASGPASDYLPLAPLRVLDTRDTAGARLAAGEVRTVDLTAWVPVGTTAVAVNLTSAGPTGAGFLTGYACGPQRPFVSSVNYPAGVDRGSLAVLPVSAERTLCVFASAATDLIVDVQGAFVPVGTRFTPVVPARLLDTRDTGRATMLTVAAPAGAAAVALNLTVAAATAAGFLTAYPCGAAMPTVSNVNFRAAETVAGAAFVPVGAGGAVCIFTNVPADVVVDLTGTFSATGSLRFTPAVPVRTYDTRDGTGGWTPVHGAGQTVDVRVAPPEAAAVTGTLTIVGPARDGFLTAHGCAQAPPTSNVNAAANTVMANSVTVGTAAGGRLCIAALAVTNVVFDTTGWWTAAVPAPTLQALRIEAPGDPLPPPAKRVYVVAESVGLGAKAVLPLAFGSDWLVTVDGTPALFVEQLESQHVRARMATTPSVFGDVAVVAGGHNYPYWDPARFDRSIDSMMAALREAGVKHILWVTLREVKPEYISAGAWNQVQPYYWYFPTVNDHLERALQRHPDLTLVDWAAIADRPGITYDAIHLNSTGAALYSGIIAETARNVLSRPATGATTVVPVSGVAGAGAAAVAVNLTAVGPRAAGYLTAFPCTSHPPLVSNANYVRDQIVAAAAIVPVGADGRICVFDSQSAHVVVDVGGSFPTGAGFVPVTPSRLLDTRERVPAGRPAGGETLVVPVRGRAGVSADAAAVAVSVTATEPAAAGFVTVTPCGQPASGTSNLNFAAGATAANLALVAPGSDGSICVTSNVATHVVVDVFGAFTPAASLGLVAPARLVDTRLEPVRRPGPGGGTVSLQVRGRTDVADDATGVILNLTAVDATDDGFLTAYPCSTGLPTASNLNVVRGETRANFVLVRPDANGDVCVFSSIGTDVVVDLLGWTGSVFAGITPTRAVDTRRIS